MNPHKRIAYKILSLARLPVPTLLHKPHTIMITMQDSIGVTGFEPATSWSQTRRSSQAEPHPVIFFCSLATKHILTNCDDFVKHFILFFYILPESLKAFGEYLFFKQMPSLLLQLMLRILAHHLLPYQLRFFY